MCHILRSVDDRTIVVGHFLVRARQEYGASPCGPEQRPELAGAKDGHASAEPAAAPCWRRLPATRRGQGPPIPQYSLLRQRLVAGRPTIHLPKMAPMYSYPPDAAQGAGLDQSSSRYNPSILV